MHKQTNKQTNKWIAVVNLRRIRCAGLIVALIGIPMPRRCFAVARPVPPPSDDAPRGSRTHVVSCRPCTGERSRRRSRDAVLSQNTRLSLMRGHVFSFGVRPMSRPVRFHWSLRFCRARAVSPFLYRFFPRRYAAPRNVSEDCVLCSTSGGSDSRNFPAIRAGA